MWSCTWVKWSSFILWKTSISLHRTRHYNSLALKYLCDSQIPWQSLNKFHLHDFTLVYLYDIHLIMKQWMNRLSKMKHEMPDLRWTICSITKSRRLFLKSTRQKTYIVWSQRDTTSTSSTELGPAIRAQMATTICKLCFMTDSTCWSIILVLSLVTAGFFPYLSYLLFIAFKLLMQPPA